MTSPGPGREAAARAVEARLGFLGKTQKDLGIDTSIYRDFVKHGSWPHPRTRSKIEVALEWPVGRIAEIAHQAATNAGAIADLLETADDPDERALLLSSELDERQKRRLIARLWAAEKFPLQQGEQAASQDV